MATNQSDLMEDKDENLTDSLKISSTESGQHETADENDAREEHTEKDIEEAKFENEPDAKDSLNIGSTESLQNETATKKDTNEEYKESDFNGDKHENKPDVSDSLNIGSTESAPNETANGKDTSEEYKENDFDGDKHENEPDVSDSLNIGSTESAPNETANGKDTSEEYKENDFDGDKHENKPDANDSLNIGSTESAPNEITTKDDTRKEYNEEDFEEAKLENKSDVSNSLNISPSEGVKNEIAVVNNTSEEGKKRRSEETVISYTPFIGLLVAVLILFGAVVFQLKSDTDSTQKSKISIYLKEVEILKSNYGQQSETFWNNIQSFPYFLLSEETPESPAVLLMVTPAGGLNLALQLAEQLAHILHKLLKSSSTDLHIVNGTSLTDEHPDDQKLMIDDGIRMLVEEQGQKVVVVANLEKIDPSAVMIFHAYCDNSDAIYNDIAILFILELPSGVNVKHDGNVYSYLSRIWGRLGKSRCQALFSRMANNIIIIATNKRR